MSKSSKFLIIVLNLQYIVLGILSPAIEKSEKTPTSITISPEFLSQNTFKPTDRQIEIGQRFLQQYHSFKPVLILVDNVKQSHQNAFDFMKTIHQLEPKIQNVNFMLMKFNSTGATTILETTKNNQIKFKELLKYNQYDPEATNFLGKEINKKSAVFFGILNAVQYLPPLSGIIVFTKRQIGDEQLVPLALSEVRKKRIRVFTVWGDVESEKLLKEFSFNTEGAYYENPLQNQSERYYEEFVDNSDLYKSMSTILSRKNLQGDVRLNFPVDSDVTGIYISITPNITDGMLLTPQGSMLDLLSDELSSYSAGSFTHRDVALHEIYLNTTIAPSQDVGIWRLRVSNIRTFFNLTIFAHSKLTTNAFITFDNRSDNGLSGSYRKIMKLGITGDITSITNITLVKRNGDPILDQTDVKVDQNWEKYLTENVNDTEPNQQKQFDIEFKRIPQEPFYAEINGKDSKGHNFKRLSYVKNNYKIDSNFYLPPISIDVGVGSELLTQPLRQPQVYFEVTNNGNSPTFLRFTCRDDKSNLRYMSPLSAWVGPQETVLVRLILITGQGSYQDIITFSAISSEVTSKQIIVDVGTYREDSRDPELHYQFTSDCIGVTSCADGSWTVEVKAKDTDSGILHVGSRPKGLHFPSGFTTGTTQEVIGYYSESCCRPDLELVAYDRQHNRVTKKINAYWANLGPWAIAAIVLAIIIFLVIIIILIVLCRKFKWCCSKQKSASYDLPRYKGPTGSKKSNI